MELTDIAGVHRTALVPSMFTLPRIEVTVTRNQAAQCPPSPCTIVRMMLANPGEV
jgi:hypothetical protein